MACKQLENRDKVNTYTKAGLEIATNTIATATSKIAFSHKIVAPSSRL